MINCCDLNGVSWRKKRSREQQALHHAWIYLILEKVLGYKCSHCKSPFLVVGKALLQSGMFVFPIRPCRSSTLRCERVESPKVERTSSRLLFPGPQAGSAKEPDNNTTRLSDYTSGIAVDSRIVQ